MAGEVYRNGQRALEQDANLIKSIHMCIADVDTCFLTSFITLEVDVRLILKVMLWRPAIAYHFHLCPLNLHSSGFDAFFGSADDLRPNAVAIEGQDVMASDACWRDRSQRGRSSSNSRTSEHFGSYKKVMEEQSGRWPWGVWCAARRQCDGANTYEFEAASVKGHLPSPTPHLVSDTNRPCHDG